MVEVLVALVVIAIGFLGIAKMQGLALSSTGASRTRALVAIEASSLAGAMHADRVYWQSSSAPSTLTVTLNGAGSAPTFSNAPSTLTTALSSVSGSGQCSSNLSSLQLSCYCQKGNNAPCTSILVAASDIYDWGVGLSSVLSPTTTAKVACTTSNSPVDCTISITWNENTVSLTSQETSAASVNGSTPAAFQNTQYVLYVVP